MIGKRQFVMFLFESKTVAGKKSGKGPRFLERVGSKGVSEGSGGAEGAGADGVLGRVGEFLGMRLHHHPGTSRGAWRGSVTALKRYRIRGLTSLIVVPFRQCGFDRWVSVRTTR